MNPARVLALFWADVRALVRDRGGAVALVLLFLGIGAFAPGGVVLAEHMRQDGDDEGPDPAWECQPGAMATVALAGDAPAWLTWPDPYVSADVADVMLRVTPGQIDVVELHDAARASAVRACVMTLADDERRVRLDALGISEGKTSVVAVRTLPPAPEGAAAALAAPPVAVALLGALLVALFSVFLELGPRARASGWLESVLVLPGARADLVLAWWLVGLATTTLGMATVVLGDAVVGALLHVSTGAVPWALLPALAVAVSAVGVRTFVDVPDFRTALVQAVPAGLVVVLLLGIALLAEGRMEGLGALVPVGGLLLAAVGGTSAHVAATASAVVASGLLLADSERALDRVVVRGGALGRTGARRARGDYLPEAALLWLVAVAGVGAWAPPEMLLEDALVRAALTFVLFLALPALLAPVALRLDFRALLSWRAPPRHAWLLGPVVAAGMLALGMEIFALARWIFPDEALLAQLAEGLGELDTPAGRLLIAVGPGVCEELLFRGAILGLLRRRLPAWAAVVLQAAGFALLHALAVRVPHTFALGVVLGLLTVRTGSIWPAMLVHAAHNYVLTQVTADQLDAWLHHPAAIALAALGVAAAWASGRRR